MREPATETALAGEIFTADQHREVMRRLRGAMVSVEGKKLLSAVWFSMQELCNGEWRFAAANNNNAINERV